MTQRIFTRLALERLISGATSIPLQILSNQCLSTLLIDTPPPPPPVALHPELLKRGDPSLHQQMPWRHIGIMPSATSTLIQRWLWCHIHIMQFISCYNHWTNYVRGRSGGRQPTSPFVIGGFIFSRQQHSVVSADIITLLEFQQTLCWLSSKLP